MRISDWSSDVCSSDLLKVKAGIDPLEERQREAVEALAAAQAAQVAGVTYKTVAETYIATNEGSWRNNKHRQQWKKTVATYVYPGIGDKIGKALCLDSVVQEVYVSVGVVG